MVPMTDHRGHNPWAYAAFVLGMLFALVSLYWTVGGTALLDTVGGSLEAAGRKRSAAVVVILALTTAVKAGGAVFSLALVRPWGNRLPRRLLLWLGWIGTAVLIGYGGTLVAVQALVVAGVIDAPGADLVALRWHLYLWDAWSLVWGVLLGLAVLRFSRQRPSRHQAGAEADSTERAALP